MPKSWGGKLNPWSASLSVEVEPGPRGGALGRTAWDGPVRPSRPFYPIPGLLELAILHPPGGLVEGDRLSLELKVKAGAKATFTTPGAQKLYRARDWQTQTVDLSVEEATLEWLPQGTIAFSGAMGRLSLSAEVAPGGRFLGWDFISLGVGDKFASGRLIQDLEIKRSGRLVFKERWDLNFPQGQRWLDSPLGFQGQATMGALWALGRAGEEEASLLEEAVDEARKEAAGGGREAVTVRGGLLLARSLGPSAEIVRAFLEKVRRSVRKAWGEADYRPRLWLT